MESNKVQKQVSSFDLEPNPFEQSFASTKREVGGIGRPVLQQPRQHGQGLLGMGGVSQGVGDQKTLPRYHVQQKPPALHSPPVLTPGGSHRLSAMLLSPQLLQTQMPALSPLIHGGQPATQTTPNFLMGLNNKVVTAKSGLQANESGLRTGLTPGIIEDGQPASLPMPNSGQFTPGLSSILSSIPMETGRTPSAPGLPPYAHTLSTVLEAKGASPNLVSDVGIGSAGTPHSSTKIALELPKERTQSIGHSERKRTLTAEEHTVPDSFDSSSNESGMNSGATSSAHNGTNIGTSSSITSLKKIKKSQEYSEENEERNRKRQEFLERNRLAASKFRKRKKEYIKKIETDLQFYETEYTDLTLFVDRLAGYSSEAKEAGRMDPNLSLFNLLKQSLARQDLPTAMALVSQIEQLMVATKYVQRNGKNPREDSEDKKEDH
ncbi:HBR502Wp [Eremothecium sinecaudum]|uniref:HBR502Wp n=1 Tax=Eremothecium sinecaudum TaxID=45286 RepID=A0A109UXR4_9SACH|nr:HBR502Wp [Eremothecium sinecaudum]AMD19403.1 HBR502Wp [Eremothecium sinecaudum]